MSAGNRKRRDKSRAKRNRMSRHQKGKTKPRKAAQESYSLDSLLHLLEHRCFFELSAPERSAIKKLESSLNAKIEAWSFVPHPEAMKAVRPPGQQLTRFIFTIDT